MLQVKAENQNKPATKKQRYALWLASEKKTDYREMPLTMLQASELLASLNKSRETALNGTSRSVKVIRTKQQSLESEFKDYMVKNMDIVAKETEKTLGIESVVMNDTSMVKDDGKRYRFFGFGCAFVWIEFDKRSKKAKQIDEMGRKLHLSDTFTKAYLSHFPKKMIDYYQSIGSPLLALYSQDISIQQAYYANVLKFMQSKGVKKAWVNYRYD